MRTSLIITILNEEKTIVLALNGIATQTILPNEIIVVDGGSSDETLEKIATWRKTHLNFSKKIKVFVKKSNRSIGRNFAIKKTKNEWIAITDAGCIPNPNWLEELITKQKITKTNVVAGYYHGLPKNAFEEAVIPYVLVMPDKVNENSFLPATRSMLINKKTWKKIGGFDETLKHNEDYAFAKKLEKNVKISFAKKAQVGWLPRKNLASFAKMIFRFAYGDIEAGILRPKIISIFGRYLVIGFGFLLSPKMAGALILIYLSWSIWKNKKYTPKGWGWLPILQITSDFAVMSGSFLGTLKFLQFLN